MSSASNIHRILIVEDHVDTGEVFKMLLEKKHFEVALVQTGRAALAAVAKEHFDLVIVDIGLPDMTGWRLFAEARKCSPDIKGIATSGYGMESDVRQSLASGLVAHLTKPFAIDSILRAIESADHQTPSNAALHNQIAHASNN